MKKYMLLALLSALLCGCASKAENPPAAPQQAPAQAAAPASEPTPAAAPAPEPAPEPAPMPVVPDDTMVMLRDYLPTVEIELKYATADNFTGQVIYQFTEPQIRYGTAVKLQKAEAELEKRGYRLKIWDAYRPGEAQWALWNAYPDPVYVANPANGLSGHCCGHTVDVTLVKMDGSEVEMPTGFDDFSLLADRDYSDVPPERANNAMLLQNVMEAAGFRGYAGEWWDFSDTTDYPAI